MTTETTGTNRRRPEDVRAEAVKMIGELEDGIEQQQKYRANANEAIRRMRAEIAEWKRLLPRKSRKGEK